MSASTSGYQSAHASGASWRWPDYLPEEPTDINTDRPDLHEQHSAADEPEIPQQRSSDSTQPKPERHWHPRTCRICLETVYPTSRPPSENLPSFLQGRPHVVYESEGGRLLRPCKCKGSSKYVHESCLETWRHTDRSYAAKNFWQCPTCRFQYRLERMAWGRWISSTATQIVLTLGIFVFSVFILGFVAGPIINIAINSQFYWYQMPRGDYMNDPYLELDPSWTAHFLKGFAALGLLSLVKVLGIVTTIFRIRAPGRDRLANITWLVLLIGALTFLYTVWKGVRAWSRRFLEKAGARVMDVQGPDHDDEDEDGVHDDHSNPTNTK